MTSWTKELDEASSLATKSGYWHTVLFYLLCGLAAIPTSFLVFTQVFTNATPEHWCSPPPELQVLSLTDEELRAMTVLQGKENNTFDSCLAYDVNPKALYIALSEYVDERSEMVREGGALRLVRTRQLISIQDEEQRLEQLRRVKEAVFGVRSKDPVPCPHGWTYSTKYYQRTLVTDFDLVCDNDWWPRLSNTLFWVGSIFGNLFFGWMSDKYGRRTTILIMILLEVPLSIITSFPSSYWSYTVMRVVCGLFFPALYQQPFILALELMPPSKRTYTGIVISMLFAGGICILAVMAFFLRNWFTLSLATSVPFVILFSFYWLIPESPRWLVGRGRIAEAEKVLRDLAKRNGIDLPYGFLLELHRKVKEEEDAAIEAHATNLIAINGHISEIIESNRDDSYLDRRINNMITFKPDLNKVRETDENLIPELERILAIEVADIVNKKTQNTVSINIDDSKENKETKDKEDEKTYLDPEVQEKSIQTEPFSRTSAHILRRKSVQIVHKILNKETDIVVLRDNKIMDDQNSIGDCEASTMDIFRYPNIRKKFIILTFDWVALGVVYNSLSYNTPNLGVNDYLAFFISGAVELPSYYLAWKLMDRYGRRWVLCVFMSIGGLACLSCVFVPEAMPWVTVSLVMISKLCSAASFGVFYVQIGELLPTVLRAQAMGAASFIAGLGLLACPYIVYLTVYYRVLPLVIIGVLSVSAGVTSLFLPETLNQPLPQTLSDGEMFGRNFKVFSCVQSES